MAVEAPTHALVAPEPPSRRLPVDLSVVIPAYNEESRLGRTLEATSAYLDASGLTYEVLVVDDGSRDGTAALVGAGASDRVRLLRLPTNQGKGAAVRAGVLASTGAHVLFMDADGSTPIREVAKLLTACESGAAVVVGSRRAPGAEVSRPWGRRLATSVFSVVLRALLVDLVGDVRDTQCGFKLFRGDLARELFADARVDGYAFDVEILALAHRRARVLEVPVEWAQCDGSKVSLARDTIRMLRDVLGIRRTLGRSRGAPRRGPVGKRG